MSIPSQNLLEELKESESEQNQMQKKHYNFATYFVQLHLNEMTSTNAPNLCFKIIITV